MADAALRAFLPDLEQTTAAIAGFVAAWCGVQEAA